MKQRPKKRVSASQNQAPSGAVAAQLNLAVEKHQAGHILEAEELYKRILAANPRHFDALHLSGVAAWQTGRGDEAVALITRALAVSPNAPEALFNLGNILGAQGKTNEAIAAYRKLLRLKPDHPEALCNLGAALQNAGQNDEAIDVYRKALSLSPDHTLALCNLGTALREKNRRDEAADCFQKALQINPDYPEALSNFASLLAEQGKFDEAAPLYQRVLKIQPDFPEVLSNYATVLREQGHLEEAVAHYQRAVQLQPLYGDAQFNLGLALKDRGCMAEALEHQALALRIHPDHLPARAEWLHLKQYLGDWRDFAFYERTLIDRIALGNGDASPFMVLALDSTPREQWNAAQKWAKARYALPASDGVPPRPARAEGRIRLAYVSADFHRHPMAALLTELFEKHDRAKFEIIAYSYGPDDGSDERRRFVKAFDRFVDVQDKTPEAIAQRIHDDGIDILIDRKGYTQNARPLIVARRPAPIQVNYIAYSGTMGADFIDYIIVDPFIVTPENASFFSEKLVVMPHCYQPNTRRTMAETVPDRAACGLPESGFVFCCFNNSYKITPHVFDVWMRLLREIPASVLWLLDANAAFKDNLRREAETRGVNPNRLVFAPRALLPDHLARHRHADLFLDTYPVGAHTTASDALWAGLPVLCCVGSTLISRASGSISRAAGLPELVTDNLEDYYATALRLAKNPEELAALRRRAVEGRDKSPLFDIETYTRDLESAFTEMWRIHGAGEAPRSFKVGDPSAPALPLPAPNLASKRVALTLDDGPNPQTTEALLGLFETHGIKANFFVLGRQVELHPELARRIVAAGHGLYSHSYDHPAFSRLSPEAIRDQLERTENLLSLYRPTPSPYPLRFPYGDSMDNPAVIAAVKAWRDDIIPTHWSMTPEEWTFLDSCRTPEDLAAKSELAVQRLAESDWEDGIILLHDWPAEQETTQRFSPLAPGLCVDVAERFIAILKARKLETVFLDQTLAPTQAPVRVLPCKTTRA